MSEDVFVNDGTECLELSVNGRREKINKGTITDLKALIGGKATAAGVSKYKVHIDGEKATPDTINDFDVSDISVIEISTFDKVA